MERRGFLKTLGFMPIVTSVPCSAVENPATPGPAFFSAAETSFINAALERLIPSDELGPGAKEAGVVTFIDRQLGGPFGRAQTWYMQGPWKEGTTQQGYQLKLTPAELYRIAIEDVDVYCRRTFGNRPFAELDGATRDKVLKGLEHGEIELARVPAKQFFAIFWQNVQEGFLADPMYGGNRDFAGWKLVGFPGARYNYVDEIEKYGERYTEPPVGVLGRDSKRRIR